MSDCKICHGVGKTRCMFCGYRPKRKIDMTVIEQIKQETLEEEITWLQRIHDTMKNLGMASTGSFVTDEKIRKRIGDWGDLTRGEVTTVNGESIGVRLDSGMDLVINCNYRATVPGQRVTVRFLNGVAKL